MRERALTGARNAPLAITLVAALVAAVTVWALRHFARYQPWADLRQTAPVGMDRIGLQIADATVSGRDNGRLRWRVSCRVITFSRDRHSVDVDGVRRGRLFDADQRPVAAVEAGHATYQIAYGELLGGQAPAAGDLHLSGGVRAALLRGPGLTLAGDGLTWDAAQSQIQCPGVMTARAGGLTAVGSAVTLDTARRALSLRDLSGTLHVPSVVQHDMTARSSSRSTLLLGGSLGLLPTLGLAAPATAPSAAVQFHAGDLQYLETPRVVELTQGVTFSQDDAFLKTDAAIVNLDEQRNAQNAHSESPVHLYNLQDDLTGRQGDVDFTRHLATLHDNVTLVVKPGPQEAGAPPSSLRSRFKDAATITCQAMIYDYRRKVARVPGALTVRQKGRLLTADAGEYDSRTQTVTLIGNVHGHNGPDELLAPKMVVGVEEGKEFIRLFGGRSGITGHWNVKDDNAGDSPAPTPAPPGGGPDVAYSGASSDPAAPAPKAGGTP